MLNQVYNKRQIYWETGLVTAPAATDPGQNWEQLIKAILGAAAIIAAILFIRALFFTNNSRNRAIGNKSIPNNVFFQSIDSLSNDCHLDYSKNFS